MLITIFIGLLVFSDTILKNYGCPNGTSYFEYESNPYADAYMEQDSSCGMESDGDYDSSGEGEIDGGTASCYYGVAYWWDTPAGELDGGDKVEVQYELDYDEYADPDSAAYYQGAIHVYKKVSGRWVYQGGSYHYYYTDKFDSTLTKTMSYSFDDEEYRIRFVCKAYIDPTDEYSHSSLQVETVRGGSSYTRVIDTD